MITRLDDEGRERQVAAAMRLELAANVLELAVESETCVEPIDNERQSFDESIVELQQGAGKQSKMNKHAKDREHEIANEQAATREWASRDL